MFKLAGETEGELATVSCLAAYYDGTNLEYVRGDVHGKVVSPRGDSTFGFDFTFVPEGYDQTYAEMPIELKNSISHRSIAIKLLIDRLEKLGITSS